MKDRLPIAKQANFFEPSQPEIGSDTFPSELCELLGDSDKLSKRDALCLTE
ncbi:hypothetical protein [Fervidibacter sacchari]